MEVPIFWNGSRRRLASVFSEKQGFEKAILERRGFIESAQKVPRRQKQPFCRERHSFPCALIMRAKVRRAGNTSVAWNSLCITFPDTIWTLVQPFCGSFPLLTWYMDKSVPYMWQVCFIHMGGVCHANWWGMRRFPREPKAHFRRSIPSDRKLLHT